MVDPIQTPVPNTTIPTPSVRPASTPNIKKSASKISVKMFMIGCGALFLIVIGGLALVLYNLIQNPSGLSQLSSVGLSPTTTKSLLQTFSVIFFGLIVFLGIAVLITNLYRIITVKNKSKIRYGFGIILGLFLFVLAIGLGAKINTLITNLSLENILDSNQLVMPYLQTKS